MTQILQRIEQNSRATRLTRTHVLLLMFQTSPMWIRLMLHERVLYLQTSDRTTRYPHDARLPELWQPSSSTLTSYRFLVTLICLCNKAYNDNETAISHQTIRLLTYKTVHSQKYLKVYEDIGNKFILSPINTQYITLHASLHTLAAMGYSFSPSGHLSSTMYQSLQKKQHLAELIYPYF